MRAQTLFDDVSLYYKGTERAEDVLNYLAQCYIGQKDYYSASEYFKTYVRNYPKGKYIVNSKFMVGYCYYLDSPDTRLDQESTRNAIEAFQEFIDIYPESSQVALATELLEKMVDKLAEKEYLSAKLYYDLGNYLGNNYKSAIVVAQNALKKYPSSRFREELSFLILQSRHKEVEVSIDALKKERSYETIDECYSFVTEFPGSKHVRAAERILAEMQKNTKE